MMDGYTVFPQKCASPWIKLDPFNVGYNRDFAILGNGDFFGESCLAGQPFTMKAATVIGDATVICVEKPAMIRLLRQDPTFSTSGFARQIASIEAGLQPPEISVGNLDARRDLTDVRDTVRAYRTIAERGEPGRAYNICSGHAVAIRDVLDLLIARARVPIRVHVDPVRFRPNDVPLLLGDPRRLRDELGWRPAIPLEQTLDDILQYWRQKVQ